MLTRALLILAWLSSAAWAQDLEPVTVLQPGAVRAVTVPTFGAWGEPACDQERNLYFHLDTGAFDNIAVYKLWRRGDRGTTFRPALSDTSPLFNSLAISPSGTLYVLGDAPDGHFLIRFQGDGAEESRIRIGSPENLHVESFGAFDDGGIVLAGYFNRLAPAGQRGKNYVGLFDAAGRLVKTMTGDFGTTDLADHENLPETGMTVGGDGNAYFLGSGEIRVISESGLEVRRLRFRKPKPEMAVTRMHYSHGMLALVFMSLAQEGKKRKVMREYMVLDSVSGEVMGRYAPPVAIGNEDVCFSEEDGFTFFASNPTKQLVLVDAHLR